MGLLDRVKQNQTGEPAATVGGKSGRAPVAPTGVRPAPAVPVGGPAGPPPTSAPPPQSTTRSTMPEQMPAFTAAKVQIHAKLIERFADQIDSSNKEGVRAKIAELADEYFRTTAITMTKSDRERLVESVLD